MGQSYSSQLNDTSRINYSLIYPYKNRIFAPQKQGNSSGALEGSGKEVGAQRCCAPTGRPGDHKGRPYIICHHAWVPRGAATLRPYAYRVLNLLLGLFSGPIQCLLIDCFIYPESLCPKLIEKGFNLAKASHFCCPNSSSLPILASPMSTVESHTAFIFFQLSQQLLSSLKFSFQVNLIMSQDGNPTLT